MGFSSNFTVSQSGEVRIARSASWEQKQKDDQIRDEAILLLKDNLAKSKSIISIRQRTDVIVEASAILWDFDRSFAAESLNTFIQRLLADFKELSQRENRSPQESVTVWDLDYALRKSLGALTKKDPKDGILLQSEYFKIRATNLRVKNLNEELDLATEGLGADEQQTLNLLYAVLQQRIPERFPKLILDLRSKNPRVADVVVQKAIQFLSANPNYKVSDAIYLSTAVFNEEATIIPLLSDLKAPNSFGIQTFYLGSLRKSSTSEHISSYFVSVQRFFDSRLMNQAGGFFDSPQNLIQAYFLLEKLKSYGQMYGVLSPRELDRIYLPVLAAMQISGFQYQTLSSVSGYALRIATSNNPLGLDDGSGALEKAENAKTPEEKLDYLIFGIIETIESDNFSKAERKIFDIENSEIRDALFLLLYMHAGLYAIENSNWGEFEKRAEKVTDKKIKAFLYLKAISVLNAGDKSLGLLTEYIIKAEKNIDDISDITDLASAQTSLTSLAFSIQKAETIRRLSLMISSINEAPNYMENSFEVRIKIPTKQGQYAEFVGANSFRDVFSKLARNDWTEARVRALQIQQIGLQAVAQIVSAKAVLLRTKR